MVAHLTNNLYWKPDAEQVLLAVIFQFPFDDQLNLKRGHTSVSKVCFTRFVSRNGYDKEEVVHIC